MSDELLAKLAASVRAPTGTAPDAIIKDGVLHMTQPQTTAEMRAEWKKQADREVARGMKAQVVAMPAHKLAKFITDADALAAVQEENARLRRRVASEVSIADALALQLHEDKPALASALAEVERLKADALQLREDIRLGVEAEKYLRDWKDRVTAELAAVKAERDALLTENEVQSTTIANYEGGVDLLRVTRINEEYLEQIAELKSTITATKAREAAMREALVKLDALTEHCIDCDMADGEHSASCAFSALSSTHTHVDDSADLRRKVEVLREALTGVLGIATQAWMGPTNTPVQIVIARNALATTTPPTETPSIKTKMDFARIADDLYGTRLEKLTDGLERVYLAGLAAAPTEKREKP